MELENRSFRLLDSIVSRMDMKNSPAIVIHTIIQHKDFTVLWGEP